jgi:ATP-dependent Clp protease ATP-binding subunit ClpA
MVIRLSEDARKAMLRSAAEEAARRGDRRIGTDHLLLGLLREPGSLAVEVLGVDLDAARAASDDLDRIALAAVGVEAGGMPGPAPLRARRHLPLSSGARAVMVRAVEGARAAKARRIEVRHLLLALLACERPDPAAVLLEALHVDRTEARERLRSSG